MDFYLILQEIMQEKDINIPTVARMCNLSDGTVRSIIKRKQKNVALEVAFKISNGLNVSLERLNGQNTVDRTPNMYPQINALMQKAQLLNPQGISKLNEYADDLVASGNYSKTKSKETAI